MEKVDLGQKIRQVRIARSYTQQALAQRADIGCVYLSEVERGIKMPSLNVFIRLVEALGVSADYLLRDEITSGGTFISNELTEQLKELTPRQRKGAVDILKAYISNIE